MKRRPIACTAVMVLLFMPAMLAGERDSTESLPVTYKIRDAEAAKKAAENFFVEQGPEWVRQNRPYRADQVFYTRSPQSLGTALKRGDPIWVVEVLNDAQSVRIQVPIGVVWIRAEDGAVFVTDPKKT
jgi:hypothetical protein